MEEVELFKLKDSVDANAKQCRNGKKKLVNLYWKSEDY